MWAVLLLFIAAASAGSKQNGSVSPVEKVADLLVKLEEKVVEEGKAEEVLFTKFNDFCHNQEDEKFWLAAKGAKKVERLDTEIADHEACIEKRTQEIADLETEITTNNEQIDTETAEKEATSKEFAGTIADLDEVIRQVKEAIVHLSASDVSGTGLISTNVLTQALSLPHVEDASIKKLMALVKQDPGKPHAYKFQSKVVIDLLENLLTQFKNKRVAQDNEAMTSRSQSEKSIQEQKNLVKSLINQKTEKQAESDENTMQKQDKQNTRDGTAKDLHANTDFLQNLVGCQQVKDTASTEGADKLTAHLEEQTACPSEEGECGVKRKNYAERVKTRGEELVALKEAIALIKGKAGGKYAANKRLVGLVSRHVAQSVRQDPTEPYETEYSVYAVRRTRRKDSRHPPKEGDHHPPGGPDGPYPPGGPPHPAGDHGDDHPHPPPAGGPPLEVEEITEVDYEPPRFFAIRREEEPHEREEPPAHLFTDASQQHDAGRKAVRTRHLRAAALEHHDRSSDEVDDWEEHDRSSDELDEYDHECHDPDGCDEDDEEDDDEEDGPSMFLQVSRKLTAKKLLRFLNMRAKSLKSSQLSALLLKVEMQGDHFKEVRELINGLITRLENQLTEETQQKEWCDEQLKETHAKRTEAQNSVEEASSNIDSETAKKSLLQTEIGELRKQIAEDTAAKAEQEEMRTEEKGQNRQTVKDAKEGLQAVTDAIEILKKFYDANAGVLLQKQAPSEEYRAEGADAEGRTIADIRPESDVFEGTYGGSQKESKGIIGILEVIEADYARTVKSVTAGEEESHAAWTESDKKIGDGIKEDETTVKTKTDEKDVASEAITENETNLADAKTEHKSREEELATLKPLCSAAESAEQLEERRKRREQEVASLREALTILREV